MNYIKEAFYPRDIGHAKEICLSPEPGVSYKFDMETKVTVELFIDNVYAFNDAVIGDYGCGVGRISKGLISSLGCTCYGFDFSLPMLQAATQFVASKKFIPVSTPLTEDEKVNFFQKFDTILSIYVLQHSPTPEEDIDFIYDSLKDDGKFITVNENKRFIPVGIDDKNAGLIYWEDDGININEMISKKFNLVAEHPYPRRFDVNFMVWEKKTTN
jgi:SAM-dependent methyltransferase